MGTKENKFAFGWEGKESFRERLEMLIGGRSIRSAAKAWGLPASTINNYLHKGTEPALKVVLSIAEAENVSLEWLALGLNKDHGAKSSSKTQEHDNLKHTWLMIYESLDRQDIESLIRLIHKEGAKGILLSSSRIDSVDNALLLLSQEEKERLMRLYDQIKKGASEEGEVASEDSLASERKRVV